jgi:metal-sulfur cluster biosynthetic enzyme
MDETEVLQALGGVEDPEAGMSIVDLGLVYDVKVDEDNVVDILLTLTTPACPLGPLIIAQSQDAVMELEGVRDVNVEITFSPPWDPRTMASDEIKMQLGIW